LGSGRPTPYTIKSDQVLPPVHAKIAVF